VFWWRLVWRRRCGFSGREKGWGLRGGRFTLLTGDEKCTSGWDSIYLKTTWLLLFWSAYKSKCEVSVYVSFPYLLAGCGARRVCIVYVEVDTEKIRQLLHMLTNRYLSTTQPHASCESSIIDCFETPILIFKHFEPDVFGVSTLRGLAGRTFSLFRGGAYPEWYQ
jgi:hypothetical protein